AAPAHPPNLSPFPTRRSSDLDREDFGRPMRRRRAQQTERIAVIRNRSPRRGREGAIRLVDEEEIGELDDALLDALQLVAAARLRSEEHTSELQSRFDLVCRLL